MAEYKTLVKKIPVSPDKKTKQKDYLKKGWLPIVDQGQSLVGGYTDDADMAVKCELPVIVFGDHTRAVKYITFPFGAGADGIKVLQPKENILPPFLYYGTQYIVAKMPDRGYARHYQYVEKEDLPVPSLPEQERIVARIEELFSQLDAGVETLKKTKAQLSVYRQAVLKEAFESVIPESDTCKVEDVCKDIKVGIVIKPAQYYTSADVGVRAFRSANVREFAVNDSDWVYLTKAGHEANLRSEIHTGDVLVVRSGYPGTACVVPPTYNGCNAIDILIAVPYAEKILPEYLCAYTNSPLGKRIIQEKKRGVAQAHFNVSGYSKTPIIVPCLETQKRVVAEIDSRLSVCDSIEQTVDAALRQAEAMRQSILKNAFEGKLT